MPRRISPAGEMNKNAAVPESAVRRPVRIEPDRHHIYFRISFSRTQMRSADNNLSIRLELHVIPVETCSSGITNDRFSSRSEGIIRRAVCVEPHDVKRKT